MASSWDWECGKQWSCAPEKQHYLSEFQSRFGHCVLFQVESNP